MVCKSILWLKQQFLNICPSIKPHLAFHQKLALALRLMWLLAKTWVVCHLIINSQHISNVNSNVNGVHMVGKWQIKFVIILKNSKRLLVVFFIQSFHLWKTKMLVLDFLFILIISADQIISIQAKTELKMAQYIRE